MKKEKQGELYKIVTLSKSISERFILPKNLEQYRGMWLEDAVKKVLDEAKQEYEALTEKWWREYPNGDGDYHAEVLAQYREEWYKKWFGGVEKPTGEKQA